MTDEGQGNGYLDDKQEGRIYRIFLDIPKQEKRTHELEAVFEELPEAIEFFFTVKTGQKDEADATGRQQDF